MTNLHLLEVPGILSVPWLPLPLPGVPAPPGPTPVPPPLLHTPFCSISSSNNGSGRSISLQCRVGDRRHSRILTSLKALRQVSSTASLSRIHWQLLGDLGRCWERRSHLREEVLSYLLCSSNHVREGWSDRIAAIMTIGTDSISIPRRLILEWIFRPGRDVVTVDTWIGQVASRPGSGKFWEEWWTGLGSVHGVLLSKRLYHFRRPEATKREKNTAWQVNTWYTSVWFILHVTR